MTQSDGTLMLTVLTYLQVITNIFGFNKFKERTMQVIDTVPLTLPAIRLHSEALWVDLDVETIAKVRATPSI